MMLLGSRSSRAAALTVAVACALAAAGPLAGTSVARTGAEAPTWAMPGMSGYSATLEQCLTATVPAERSVTFTGQMVATPGTQRMGMRIEFQERLRDGAFHTVVAPGLGVWRGSEAGVKIYRYVKQITNLSAPAVYRAVVHFRWLGEKGHVLHRAELRTARCAQPLLQAAGQSATPSA